jgi:cell division protein ZapD
LPAKSKGKTVTDDTVIYEQPLNERIRIFLRLEELFTQTRHMLAGQTDWDSRATLASLIDILNVFERSDLKSEMIKELERHSVTLLRWQELPSVDTELLENIVHELQHYLQRVQSIEGKIGNSVRTNELIQTVRQRLAIPGGTCNFDMPAYHYWLQLPSGLRQIDMQCWLDEFKPIENAIKFMLKLIRDSASPCKELAEEGYFQKTLEPSLPCQLVRISLPKIAGFFPEISGGKHRISVRFLALDEMKHPFQISETISFILSTCTL